MSKPFRLFSYGIILAVSVFALTIAISQVLAVFSEPTTNPPGNNPAEPINAGAVTQTKTGDVGLGGNLTVLGHALFAVIPGARVHIGGISSDPRPDVKLDVKGNIITGVKTPVNPDDAVNKAYVDALSRPQYSQTCTDWLANGWASLNECLHDGRWHKVYANNASGVATFGTIAALSSHMQAGSEVRVFIPSQGFGGACDNLAIGTFIICTTSVHWGAFNSMATPPTLIHLAAIAYYTNGRVEYAQSNNIGPNPPATTLHWGTQTLATAAIDWYIKF